MSRPRKPDPDETVIPGSCHTPALEFEIMRGNLYSVVESYKHLPGFTYSPKSGLVFDVRVVSDGRALFRELIRGRKDFLADRPVYLIAFTNHLDTDIDNVLRDKYEEVSKFSNQPLIGYWKDSKGRTYLDVVAVAQFISKKTAIREGKRYGQEYILEIRPDGSHDHIEAD